jgi:hypothetical protein
LAGPKRGDESSPRDIQEAIMRVSKDDVEVQLQIPPATLRRRMNFGSVAGYDKISAEYFSFSAGVDTTELFLGLDGNQCQCPHWGYVIRGQITTTDAKGARETATTNDLFYWPPGHNVKVDLDSEIIMFSPQHEHTHVIDHMRGKVQS